MHYSPKLIFSTFFSFLLLVAPTLAHSQNNGPTFSIGAFIEPKGERYGLEASAAIKGDYFGGRLSASLYAGGNNINQDYQYTGTDYESNELYGGFSGFAFVHMGQVINPYIGLGVYLGETLHCSSSEEESGRCVEEPIAAIYPEFGVEFNIDILQVSPYIRRYFDSSDSNKSGNVYGINFGLKF